MAEPKHGNGPIGVDEQPGQRAYCQCGWSGNLPYCDGSHSRMQTGCAPIVVELADAGRRSVCQCHRSGDKPWCDGSHNRQEKK